MHSIEPSTGRAGIDMRRKLRWILVAAGVAAAFLVVGASIASASIPHSSQSPAQALCESQGGTYHGPNWVWRLDTSFMTNAGYGCEFPGPFVGGTTTDETLASDHRIAAARNVCANGYRGTFYLFEAQIGPDPYADIFIAGWACSFIF